jgi:predicted DNA-binding transcriptional regulator YafY
VAGNRHEAESVYVCVAKASAYNNKKLEGTLEKLRSIFKQEQSVKSKVKLDFIDNYLIIIDDAVNKEKVIEFEYTNSYGDKTSRGNRTDWGNI